MQSCRITISTTVDGTESTVSRMGTMQLSPLCARLSYAEENAQVGIQLEGECATIVRTGDYTLSLRLERGKECKGSIGLSGASGDITAFAHKISFSMQKDSLLLSLHYDLLIGGERQKMKLRLYAKSV